MKEATKQCRSECKKYLPLSAYGVNKNEPDGHSPYCKECNRRTSARFRKRHRPPGDPYQRVLFAIRDGCVTEHAIARRVKLHEEVLDGILAELILDRKQVVTRAEGETRKYFVRAA